MTRRIGSLPTGNAGSQDHSFLLSATVVCSAYCRYDRGLCFFASHPLLGGMTTTRTGFSQSQPAMTDLDDFDYTLPDELIAQRPLADRTAARMLVVSRADDSIEHAQVRHLPEYLRAGDCLVLNDTRVLPARLQGRRATTAGAGPACSWRRTPVDCGRYWARHVGICEPARPLSWRIARHRPRSDWC